MLLFNLFNYRLELFALSLHGRDGLLSLGSLLPELFDLGLEVLFLILYLLLKFNKTLALALHLSH